MSQQSVPPASGEPSFADQVRGLDAKPIDKTLARIMDDLYDQGPGIDGFKPLDADQLRGAGIDPSTLENKDSGFLARVYGDDKGHYVLAYSGTDEGKDWLTNFRQGLGFEDAQYNQAIALAREAKVAFGDEVVITGHSLGGGLGGAASIASGIPAVTFNSSGVHDKTLERLGIDADAAKDEVKDNGQIRRYSVKNEILTELQEHSIPLKWAMPDAVGHKIELPDPDPQSFWKRMIPGNGIKHGIDIHYIDAVIKAQEMASPETARTGTGISASDPARADGDRGVRGNVHAEVGIAAAAGSRGDAQTTAQLSHPSHPNHGLYDQALRGLHGMDAKAMDFRGEQGYRNAATHAALDARANGMDRIDHVVPGRDGGGFFIVQGGLADPGSRRAFVDEARALSPPPQVAAPAQPAPAETQQQQETRRAVMS